MDEHRIPILIGAAQITQREPDPRRALPALHLTAEAARLAADDAGGGHRLLAALDTLVVIRAFADTSWRFKSPFGSPANPPKSIANRIGASGARRLVYTHPGGNMPQWCLNRLCEQITRGEVAAALVCGGEALATQKAAERAKLELDWREDAGGSFETWGVATRGWNDTEERHRMAGAIFAYPLFETAIRGRMGRSIEAHRQANAAVFARFAAVAAANPLADRRQGYTAAQIAEVSADNPYIGFPYTKLMNANAFIDQAAAVIVTSVATARQLGIARDRWVYLNGCADAHDHWYVSDRINFHSSPAMQVVAREAFAMAGCAIDDVAHIDLYSCFPSAVQVAAEANGLALDDPRGLTITGGLPYFGGPGNNYVTHAIAEMMQRVRSAPGSKGLVTANGNYLTKQSAGIYSTDAPSKPFAPKEPARYQAEIDAAKGPMTVTAPSGRATIETYTIMHERGTPAYAIVFGRDAQDRRFIANTPASPALLRDMTERDYIGAPGPVSTTDGHATFTPS